jgi:elongation factor P hydroxylase
VGGTVQLRVIVPGVETTAVYPEEFATCPMGLLRGDLRPDEVAFALQVSHAAAADVDKRWPDVPARLYAAVREWRNAESDKMRAEHEARMAKVAHRGS